MLEQIDISKTKGLKDIVEAISKEIGGSYKIYNVDYKFKKPGDGVLVSGNGAYYLFNKAGDEERDYEVPDMRKAMNPVDKMDFGKKIQNKKLYIIR